MIAVRFEFVLSVIKDRVSEYSFRSLSSIEGEHKIEVRVGYSRLAECGEVIAVKLTRLIRSRQSGKWSRDFKAPPKSIVATDSVYGQKSVKLVVVMIHVLCHENSGLLRDRRASVGRTPKPTVSR
jgi:hypothetical protein